MPFRLVRTSAAQALVELEKLLKSMPACVQARLRFAAKPWAKLAIGAETAPIALLKVLADQLTAVWNERALQLKAPCQIATGARTNGMGRMTRRRSMS